MAFSDWKQRAGQKGTEKRVGLFYKDSLLLIFNKIFLKCFQRSIIFDVISVAGSMASISVGPQLLTLLLCVTLACVEGEWSRLCPPTSERTAAQGVCGSNLANLVRDICRSYGYNSHTLSKRKVTSKETGILRL